MGIDVSDARVVTFNPDHQRRVDTNVARNPPRQLLDTLEVVSIFARKIVATDDLDGNPLIYALKGKFGYSMPYGSFREIYLRGAEILPKALDGIDYDLIVPLPSTSAVTAIFAERAARCGDGCPVASCLEKATFQQVLDTAPPIDMVEKRYRQRFGQTLRELEKSSPDATFEMKRVSSPLRGYFLPIVAGAEAAAVAGRRVLLVDDILGSGTSITAAARALKAFGPLSIAGLTLMGKLPRQT